MEMMGISADPAVDVQKTLLRLVVKELKQVYDHVDAYPASRARSTPNEAEAMLRILIRWYDDSPLAQVRFAPDGLIVELGPRYAHGWKKVVRILYQEPRTIERILGLVEQAWP
jgi:hypothetical protein